MSTTNKRHSAFRDARLFAGIGAVFGFFGSILGATPFGSEEAGGGIFLSFAGIIAATLIGAALASSLSILRNCFRDD